MIYKLLSTSRHGLLAHIIEIEIDISNGLPSVIMVGLADKSIQESKERVRTSFKSIDTQFPLKKITVNFAPAHIYKAGSHFDLAVAVGILCAVGEITPVVNLANTVFIGELSLDGSLRGVNGIVSMLLALKKAGYTNVCIPNENEHEAHIIPGMNIIAIKSLKECIDHITGKHSIQPIKYTLPNFTKILYSGIEDFKDIKGQKLAKRALEIAAAGFHNVSLVGEPGSGKTLLSRAFQGLLPPLDHESVIECAQIYSIAHLPLDDILQGRRPFRSPHHTSSNIALTGGGSNLKPGEVTLAHNGILFLDEFAEFSTKAIETLRQPVEDGIVSISRATGSVEYPSKFILLCASNPTPHGTFSSTPSKRYSHKLSGPIIDRIDIHVNVYKPKEEELLRLQEHESTKEIKTRVLAALEIQKQRFNNSHTTHNAHMSLTEIKTHCALSKECESIMQKAIERYNLSARAFHKILKISRTIADLDGSTDISSSHLTEALLFRQQKKI